MQIYNKQQVSAGVAGETMNLSIPATTDKPVYLVGVNTKESTALGANVPDIGLIFIQPKGQNGFLLKHDNFHNTDISWRGCIPLTSDFTIVMTWFSPAVNNIESYSILTMDANEVKSQADMGHNLIGVYPYGHLKVVDVVGAADAKLLDIRPNLGWQWQVVELWGGSDDTAARNYRWHYIDSLLTLDVIKKAVSMTGSNGDNLPISFESSGSGNYFNCITGSLMLNYNIYAELTVDDLTAGKKLRIQGLVNEFAGGD